MAIFNHFALYTTFQMILIRLFLKWRMHFICIFAVLQISMSEFRFCYKGPHKFKEEDCPGGFIAFEPLNVSCIFYAKGPEIPELTVTLSANLCHKDEEIKVELNGNTDFTDVKTIHRITFDPLDETEDPTDGTEINATVCVHSCFPEYIDPFAPEDSLMLEDKPNQTEEELEAAQALYTKIAKELFVYLVVEDDDFFDDDEDILEHSHIKEDTNSTLQKIPEMLGASVQSIKGKFTFLIKLFAQTLRITMVKCGPFIEDKYMLQVLRVIVYFYESNEDYDTLNVTPLQFKRINRRLNECENSNNLQVQMNGTQCGNQHSIDSIFFTDENNTERVWRYRRLPRSFRWGIYDPAIESAWAAVDFVHAMCFQSFYAAGDILYFHLYMTAMEALFPPTPVQQHWMNPVKLKNDQEFWNMIMDTNDIQNQVRNLDACVIAAYMTNISPYRERLLRPFVKEAQLEDPKYSKFIPTGIGWKKSSDEYWRWYESVGGFKKISKNFGYCLDGSRKNLEQVEKELKEKGRSC